MSSSSNIWITGASSGIGRAAAIEFAKTGCNIFASSRRVIELERLKKDLNKEKLDINILPCNVASRQNVEQVVKSILASQKKIDCLINNAGITLFKKANENSINEIEEIIHTNLLGAIYAIKSVIPSMIERGDGMIINVLSVVAKKVFAGSSAYTASKLGLLGYTNALREELREHNIRVINILPGATDTPMWSQDLRKKYNERMMPAEAIARTIVRTFFERDNLVAEEIVLRPVQGDL